MKEMLEKIKAEAAARLGEKNADPEALRRRYEERYDTYCAAADLRVNGDGSPEDTAERIEKEWTI